MFSISSALLSQTASKRTAWTCLKRLGKRDNNMTYQDSNYMKTEAWYVGLWVNIKPYWTMGKNVIEATYHKGLTTIISWKEIIKSFYVRTNSKADSLEIERTGEKLFKVQGTQQPFYGVMAQPTKLTCNCYLFKCLDNRLNRDEESPKFQKEMREFEENGQKPYLKELVEIVDGKCTIEQSLQVQCHHIRAVMHQFFNASTMEEYLLNYQSYQSDWKKSMASKRQYLPEDIDNIFPEF
ncbi:MAG: hypothetical protein AB4057_00320 [Crocosphaera sp.]